MVDNNLVLPLDLLKSLTVGDYVVHVSIEPELEKIVTIEHNTDHFRKSYEYEYVRINSSYWRYDNIVGIVKNTYSI